ncbi:MAG TPA: aminotransferase class V-fold PLP-dependent enzyme [Burkholderiaceae bacterium]|nr:aminotransferase class V-fold PLP-dependent enzyme [Burkholderiaceae bacterium]
MPTEIYLDGNATTAVLPAAIAAAVDTMGQRFGNPSSSHGAGLQAKAVLERTRACAMRLLGVGPGRLMFNSGATEGIQTAVLSALCALRERQANGEAIGSLLLYGATEHKAVPHSLEHWNRLLGLHLTLQALPVDGDGRHDLAALRALAPRAALVCTMAANNETGIVSDLAGIEAVLVETATAAYWLVDCVQALGKLALALAHTRIDYAPFSGHKLYAPKGIGMLYVRAGAPYTPLIMGGGQEAGLRSGTENMAGIAALGAVLAALEQGGTFRTHAELAGFRTRLADSLRAALPGIVFNHAFAASLPTTLNFSVPGVGSRELMDVFDAAGVRVSSGSACSAKQAAPSYVLAAMGVPDWRASGAIRLSFGPLTDEATIAAACERIARCGAALRSGGLLPPDGMPAGHDGVLQLGMDGASGWLVLDAARRRCVVIDPLPEQTARIASLVCGQDYVVDAIAATSPRASHAPLIAALGQRFDRDAATDAYGWPGPADGAAPGALALGRFVLTAATHADGQRSYLLATAAQAPATAAAAVRFAFCATVTQPGLQACVGPDTLLCPTRDAQHPLCTSSRALAASVPPTEAGVRLDPGALAAFLQAHPDARLVDVREPYECAATAAMAGPSPGGRPVIRVPLGQLADRLDQWLHGEQPPLVLYCRSGNRSLKAAQCLRRLGYRQAWSLDGGLALAPLALAA